MLGLALAQHQAALQLRDFAVDVVGLGQVLHTGFLRPALGFGHRRDLGIFRRIRYPLVALVAQEQAGGDLGTGAGGTDIGHGTMRVLDGELKGRTQLVRIERTMAGLVDPARVLVDELGVADLAPVADAGGIAGERDILLGVAVVGGALTREPHRDIGIALAGTEAVAHADDKQVDDLEVGAGHFLAADLDRQTHAGRIGYVEPQRLAAQLGDRFAAGNALGAWRCEPGALDRGRILDAAHLGDDGVARRIDVSAAVRANVAVAFGIPAGLADHGAGPAVGVAARQRPLGGQDRLAAFLVGEVGEGRPMHFGVGGIIEETEWVLDAPGDLRLR